MPGQIRQMERIYPRLFMPATWKPAGKNLAHLFTPKELNIMDGVLHGFNNFEIAKQLHTTHDVIRNYLRVIFDKAGVDSRLQLAIWWLHHGHCSELKALKATGFVFGGN